VRKKGKIKTEKLPEAGALQGPQAVVTDVEGAFRREIRRRRQAEKVVSSQAEALAKTLELLVHAPALPEFIDALLRTITAQCGGLWTTFWLLDEKQEAQRAWIHWRERSLAQTVETFAKKHALALKKLGLVYHDLILAQGTTMLVPVQDARVSPLIRRFYRKIGATGALLVPLKLGKNLIGWITHQRGDANIAPEQVAFLESIAQQATLALHLTRLATAKHQVESALKEERRGREHERELLAIRNLLHIDVEGVEDRVGAIVQGGLRNIMTLLHGSWAGLWRNDHVQGFAPPELIVLKGKRSGSKNEDYDGLKHDPATHTWFKKWRSAREATAQMIVAPQMKTLLMAFGAPLPDKRTARVIQVPLVFDGESLGFILVLTESPPKRSSERNVAVKALAMQAALALSLDEMSSVQRVAALTEERNRIARDLHDLLAQSFTGIVLQVEAMRVECPALPESVNTRLEKIRAQAATSAEELRRTLLSLRPNVLDQHSLADALEMLAKDVSARSGVSVSFRHRTGAAKLHARMEQHIYAIASEALQNAIRHARPRRIGMFLGVADGQLVFRVTNDGVLSESSADVRPAGFGLMNLRDRVTEMDGRFSMKIFHGLARLEATIALNHSSMSRKGHLLTDQ